MRNGLSRYKLACIMRGVLLSTSAYLVVLIPLVNAQDTIHDMSMVTSLTTTASPASTTAFTYSLNSTSSSDSQPTEQATEGPFPGTQSPNDNDERSDAVFNYYFLFLILFGVLIAALSWWLHRQKKRRKEQMQLGRQDALARDLEGWVGTRLFMHGRYGRNHNAVSTQHEEGLDERGEAPPPYQAQSETTTTYSPVEGLEESASGLTVPLRTLSRGEVERSNPPAYHNSLQPNMNESVRPVPP